MRNNKESRTFFLPLALSCGRIVFSVNTAVMSPEVHDIKKEKNYESKQPDPAH